MSDRPVTAVVTGAAMGMGKAISQRLIADGVTVVGLDLNPDALRSYPRGARREVRAGHRRRR